MYTWCKQSGLPLCGMNISGLTYSQHVYLMLLSREGKNNVLLTSYRADVFQSFRFVQRLSFYFTTNLSKISEIHFQTFIYPLIIRKKNVDAVFVMCHIEGRFCLKIHFSLTFYLKAHYNKEGRPFCYFSSTTLIFQL